MCCVAYAYAPSNKQVAATSKKLCHMIDEQNKQYDKRYKYMPFMNLFRFIRERAVKPWEFFVQRFTGNLQQFSLLWCPEKSRFLFCFEKF